MAAIINGWRDNRRPRRTYKTIVLADEMAKTNIITARKSRTYLVLVFSIAGFIWAEVKQLWSDGAKSYILDMWNLLDFLTNALYVATIALRVISYIKVSTSVIQKMERRFNCFSVNCLLSISSRAIFFITYDLTIGAIFCRFFIKRKNFLFSGLIFSLSNFC